MNPRVSTALTIAIVLSVTSALLVIWQLQPEPADPRVTHITVHAPTNRAAAALADGRIFTWPLDDTAAPTTHIRAPGGINDLEFSPDGRTLATAASNLALATWDRPTIPRYLRDGGDNYGVARYDPSTTYIATIDGKGQILILDIAAKPPVTLCCTTIYSDLRWLPGNRVVTAGHHPAIWNAATGQLIARLTPEREPMAMGPILLHPARQFILIGSQDGGIRAFSLTDYHQAAASPRTPDWVETMALSPITDWIAYAQRGHTVRWWTPATNEHREWPSTITTSTLAFTPQGLLLTGTANGIVEEWDPATRARTRFWQLSSAQARPKGPASVVRD